MNKSWHKYEGVMAHIWMSHGAYMNKSWLYEWVIAHIWRSHGTHMNESWRSYEWVMSPVCMGHVSHMNAFSRVYWTARARQFHSISLRSTWILRVNESRPPYAWVMSHAWMRHVVLLSHPSVMDMGWLRLVGSLRWGWVLLERRRILSGIQFTTHFMEIFVVETKRFVGSFVNVILTRQTCGQRSSRAAESKRRALGNDFCKWLCCMFLISKCRGDWDRLCTFWVLAKRESLRIAQFQFFLRAKHVFFWKSPLRSGSLLASTKKVQRPRSQSPVHFDIRNI